MDPRRLSDRIAYAVELAILQERLGVAEHLRRALEESWTAVGGSEAVERRIVPESVIELIGKVDDLRRRHMDPS